MAKSRKKKKAELKDKNQEKQFFYWAIGITVVALILAYLSFR